MRPSTDKYARLALRFTDKIGKKADRFQISPTLWALADYLEANAAGKHEQHLLMLASKWVKALP